jgi:hypothetical protein
MKEYLIHRTGSVHHLTLCISIGGGIYSIRTYSKVHMYTLRAQESRHHCSPQSSVLIIVYILAGISYEKMKLNHTKKVAKLRIMNIVYRNILI